MLDLGYATSLLRLSHAELGLRGSQKRAWPLSFKRDKTLSKNKTLSITLTINSNNQRIRCTRVAKRHVVRSLSKPLRTVTQSQTKPPVTSKTFKRSTQVSRGMTGSSLHCRTMAAYLPCGELSRPCKRVPPGECRDEGSGWAAFRRVPSAVVSYNHPLGTWS